MPDLGTCQDSGDCPGDSYCDSDKTCVPYGVPPEVTFDPTCARESPPPNITPAVKCEWTGPPAGDPTAGYVHVYSSPFVANLNLRQDLARLEPSIVLTTFTTEVGNRTGMLRVFDGRTCQEQMRIGGPDDPEVELNRPAYGTQWAIGDLNGDVGASTGHPEIVGLHRTSLSTSDPLNLIAFRVDSSVPSSPKLVRLWLGRLCGQGGADTVVPIANSSNSANFGPGIWDLDDDGKPEIVLDQLVFDSSGCLLSSPAEVTRYLDHGVITTVADVDHDGKPELVRHDGVYAWDGAGKRWQLEPYFAPADPAATKPGHVAVADFGDFASPVTSRTPEIVVISAASTAFAPSSSGTARLMTITGQIVLGPIELFHAFDGTNEITRHGGHGGPPTAADFDGDGFVEFAAAANQFYTVYDPDCLNAGTGVAQRPGGQCDRSEVTLPAFVTPPLPDGILWARQSQDYSSSETGSSVFDFNGDGRAEAVYRDECYLRVYDGKTGKVIYSAPASSGTGQELPVIVDVGGTFTTQIVVARAGNGGSCPSPDPLNSASGQFVKSTGFQVLSDPRDRWVPSRPIWNQHAYSVTNVGDRGEIPRASQVLSNWEQPGLNNFRQNVQGALGKLLLADFTVELSDLGALCHAAFSEIPTQISAKVCNRGTNPAPSGVLVSFSARSGADAGTRLLCEATTPTILNPGECTMVSCAATPSENDEVFVVVDPNHAIQDCHPNSNTSSGTSVICPPGPS
ncbi:MAG: hypothetical protein HY901_28635 [Deltaproteobacteria bacterium]|nr:hypothetical protein [Deltaproteobacteria bacterium]